MSNKGTAISTSTAISDGKEPAISSSVAVSAGTEPKSSVSSAVKPASKGTGSLIWVPAKHGEVPPHAVPGGEDLSGKVAYIGRGKCQEFTLPGRVVPSKKCCLIPLFGKEHPTKEYEVLTNPDKVPLKWHLIKRGSAPSSAVPAGDDRGKVVYIGRRKEAGHTLLGKIHSHVDALWVPLSGKEKRFDDDYEVLVFDK